MRKSKLITGLFMIATSVFLGFTTTDLMFFMFSMLIGVYGWNQIFSAFQKVYVVSRMREVKCFYCEQHRVTITIHQTPIGKHYTWICGNCKKVGGE